MNEIEKLLSGLRPDLQSLESQGITADHYRAAKKLVLLTAPADMFDSIRRMFSTAFPALQSGMLDEGVDALNQFVELYQEEMIEALEQVQDILQSRTAARWALALPMEALQAAIDWETSDVGQRIRQASEDLSSQGLDDARDLGVKMAPFVFERATSRMSDGEVKDFLLEILEEMKTISNQNKP